jgi:hypothetical protein
MSGGSPKGPEVIFGKDSCASRLKAALNPRRRPHQAEGGLPDGGRAHHWGSPP